MHLSKLKTLKSSKLKLFGSVRAGNLAQRLQAADPAMVMRQMRDMRDIARTMASYRDELLCCGRERERRETKSTALTRLWRYVRCLIPVSRSRPLPRSLKARYPESGSPAVAENSCQSQAAVGVSGCV